MVDSPNPHTHQNMPIPDSTTTASTDTTSIDTTSTEQQLAACEQQYRQLAATLANTGWIHHGSLARRYNRCGTPGCKCHADPPQLHGPYWQWTAKVNGKTVTRRLNDTQAGMYQEWINNDRQLHDTIKQMRHIAAHAAQLKLQQATATSPPK